MESRFVFCTIQKALLRLTEMSTKTLTGVILRTNSCQFSIEITEREYGISYPPTEVPGAWALRGSRWPPVVVTPFDK